MNQDTCMLTCVTNDRTMMAEILDFREKHSLRVAIERSVTVTLSWNGQRYVGRCAGLEFETAGPKIKTQYQGRR